MSAFVVVLILQGFEIRKGEVTFTIYSETFRIPYVSKVFKGEACKIIKAISWGVGVRGENILIITDNKNLM